MSRIRRSSKADGFDRGIRKVVAEDAAVRSYDLPVNRNQVFMKGGAITHHVGDIFASHLQGPLEKLADLPSDLDAALANPGAFRAMVRDWKRMLSKEEKKTWEVLEELEESLEMLNKYRNLLHKG